MEYDTPRFLECALITGASSGLGREFVKQLAPLCQHLILVARRKERLIEVQDTLSIQHPNLKVTSLVSDLSVQSHREALVESLSAGGITPSLLVNNAGLGDYGDFSSSEWSRVQSMLEVNISALTYLTHALLPQMIERNSGAIINVSSIASLVPLADFSVYAASKAYVTSFSEGIRSELQGADIPVLTVCPGPVHTEFGEVAGRGSEKFKAKGYELLYVEAEQVVSDSLSTLFKGKARVYPGWQVAAFATALAVLPLCAIRFFNSKRPRRSPQA